MKLVTQQEKLQIYKIITSKKLKKFLVKAVAFRRKLQQALPIPIVNLPQIQAVQLTKQEVINAQTVIISLVQVLFKSF